jgi:hypothetical protein
LRVLKDLIPRPPSDKDLQTFIQATMTSFLWCKSLD